MYMPFPLVQQPVISTKQNYRFVFQNIRIKPRVLADSARGGNKSSGYTKK